MSEGHNEWTEKALKQRNSGEQNENKKKDHEKPWTGFLKINQKFCNRTFKCEHLKNNIQNSIRNEIRPIMSVFYTEEREVFRRPVFILCKMVDVAFLPKFSFSNRKFYI